MAAFDFPSSPNVNDIYTLNGVAFMWNGSVWKRYSTSTGAQGFQGATGAAGAQGAAGSGGATGAQGTAGAAGAQGAAGSGGATGAQGAAGAAGAQGAAGAAGAQGAPFDRSEYNHTASSGQTAFPASYANASDVDVFMNGVRLTPAEYTASGGTTITLASGATAGDIIDILTFASAGPTGAQGSQGHQGDAFNRSESNFTATSGQTSFAPSGGYTNGDDLDVFVNGVRLTPADYTATNGTNVVLDVGANTGDIVDIIYYEAAGPAGAQGSAGIAGTVTFSTGAPSNPINGDLWYDTDDGAFAGYYDDGNTSQWIDLSGGPRGAQGADGAQGAAGSIPSNITAVNGTFSGNVSIAGTLTYEDVTNIDSVGVITARDTLTVYNSASTFDPHLTLYAENSNNAILVSKKASGYTGLEFRAESGGGGSIDLFYGAPSVQGGNSSYYSGIQLNDNKALIMGTGGDSLVRYDPTPGVLEIKTLVSEPIALSTNDTERLRITSAGNIGVGTDNPDATLKVNVASGNNGVVVQNTSTANIALFGARNGDATVQIGQWGSTASGSTFGLSNADLSFIYTTSYSTTHPSALALGTVSNKPIVFATNNTERLRITSDGDMGLGTLSPTSFGPTFQVAGTDPALLLQDTATSVDYFGMNIASGAVNTWFDDASAFVIHTATGLSGSGLVERLRITSAGNVGINTTTFAANGTNFKVSDGTISRLALDKTGANARKFEIGNFGTGLNVYDVTADEERLRIDSSGRVLIGATSNVGSSSVLQVREDGFGRNIEIFRSYDSANTPARIRFSNSRGTSASPTIVANGDDLGEIRFNGHDGTNYDTPAASIFGVVDGTPGVNDMPGRLEFHTTADGGSSTTERLRIKSGGEITSGNISINAYANENTPSGYSQFQSDNHSNTLFAQNLKLGASAGSGNHNIEIINQHASIGGAGMYIGGNGSGQQNAINFYAEAANQSAGTNVTANRRAQVNSSSFFTWVEPRNQSSSAQNYLRTFGFTFNLQDGETETLFYNPDGYRRIYYEMYVQSAHGSNGYGYILGNISRYGSQIHDADWHVSYTSYAHSSSVNGNVNHNGIKFTRSGYSNTNITYYVIVKCWSPAGGTPYGNSGLTDPSYRYFTQGY